MCRQTQFVAFEKPKGRKGDKQLTMVVWPMGFTILPDEGGLNMQSYVMYRLFHAFLNGERAGVVRQISKRA